MQVIRSMNSNKMLAAKAEFVTSVKGRTCFVSHCCSYQAMSRGYESFLSDKTRVHSDKIKGTLCMSHKLKWRLASRASIFSGKTALVGQLIAYSEGITKVIFSNKWETWRLHLNITRETQF